MRRRRREPKCRKCGGSLVWPGRTLCYRCLQGWKNNRISAFKEAEEKFGKVDKNNLEQIKSEVKNIERRK